VLKHPYANFDHPSIDACIWAWGTATAKTWVKSTRLAFSKPIGTLTFVGWIGNTNFIPGVKPRIICP
jgi:hypothetical protein